MQDIRVGFGFDVHRLADGRPCVLGGVTIPHDKGPLGHSDADVLIHAICDALLGAANMRDIGFHFPDTKQEFKNADSKKLLHQVVQLISNEGYQIMNVDSTLVLEQPKINPHVPLMQHTLATAIGIDASRVSIKATTNEKLGFIGREEGVTAYAVVLISR